MTSTIKADRPFFLRFSAFLTGYLPIDLEGTGMVDIYWSLFTKQINPEIIDWLFELAEAVIQIDSEKEREHALLINIAASPTLWPVCESIIMLWYRGQWNSMSAIWYKYYANCTPLSQVKPGENFVPSAQAYIQQLAYQGAGAHPPGTKPTGFGGWGLDPVFGDFIDNKEIPT